MTAISNLLLGVPQGGKIGQHGPVGPVVVPTEQRSMFMRGSMRPSHY